MILGFIRKNLILLISAIFFSLYFLHPIPFQGSNVDLGHHLLLGEIISKSINVPRENLLSYTHPNYPFVNTHWISDVVFYKISDVFGYSALTLFTVICVGTSVFILLKSSGVLKKSLILFALTFFYLQILGDRTEVKPEILSFVLLSISIWILYEFRRNATKLIFLLPLICLLWVNTHIYSIVLPIIVSIFLLEQLVLDNLKLSAKSKRLIIVLLLCVFSTFLNPNFISGAIFPFTFFKSYGYNVLENQNFFDVFKAHGNVTFIYIFCTWILLGWMIIKNWSKKNLVDILIVAAFTFLAFIAVRNFALFVFATLVPFIKLFNATYPKLSNNNARFISILFLLASIPGVMYWFSNNKIGLGVIDKASEAVAFLKANNLKGNIYNNYNIGNYLEYRIYPQKVFVDGRPEAYPVSFFKDEYYPAESSFDNFELIDKKYKFETVFYEHKNQTQTTNPLLLGLTNSSEWRMVFLNSTTVIFSKDKNLRALEEQDLVLDAKDLDSKSELGDLSNFFRVINWYSKMIEVDLKYLEYEPKNCTALRHIAVVTKKNNYINDFYINCSK